MRAGEHSTRILPGVVHRSCRELSWRDRRRAGRDPEAGAASRARRFRGRVGGGSAGAWRKVKNIYFRVNHRPPRRVVKSRRAPLRLDPFFEIAIAMQSQISLSLRQVHEFLLNVATTRPVFIWGAPGIGKSSLVEQFAADLGLECVALLGSQLAPEDLIGIPKIDGHVSRFYPPAMIVRERQFVLFIDELNIASVEIQKAFYSLILDKRIGEYRLPPGSIIVGAGNRAHDAALAKQMPSALVNRMVHVHLKASAREWLQWAESSAIHPWVLDYVRSRPTQLATEVPPAREEPFSTPRSWHGVSDALHSFGADIAPDYLDALLFGSLTRDHAIGFKAFLKQIRNRFSVHKILKGEEKWPAAPEDRDLTYFLTQSLRDVLVKELPAREAELGRDSRELAQSARQALKQLARIDGELAQLVLAQDDGGARVPDWFVLEIAKELPRLLQERAAHEQKQ
jgi:hypothetical protein